MTEAAGKGDASLLLETLPVTVLFCAKVMVNVNASKQRVIPTARKKMPDFINYRFKLKKENFVKKRSELGRNLNYFYKIENNVKEIGGFSW